MGIGGKNMTPSLFARIENRIILNLVIALPILIITKMSDIFIPMVIIGLLLDIAYNHLQYKRWDGDWPLVFTFISGLFEGAILWLIFKIKIEIYILILIPLIAAQQLVAVFIPYKRFRAGRIL